MDTDLAQVIATLARLEERQEHVVERIDSLHNLVVRVDSLETTRDRQRGAAKFAAVLVTMASVVFGVLKFWD